MSKTNRLSDKLCKKIIRGLANKYKIDPILITTRLMSDDDKNDMRNGDLLPSALETHISVWIDAGFPDYAHGSVLPLIIKEKIMKRFIV